MFNSWNGEKCLPWDETVFGSVEGEVLPFSFVIPPELPLTRTWLKPDKLLNERLVDTGTDWWTVKLLPDVGLFWASLKLGLELSDCTFNGEGQLVFLEESV